VAHVNAHATSTPEGDPPESRAIVDALGSAADGGPVVSATKSMTGHLLGGAGAVASVAAILALRDRMAPPTVNLEDLDDEVAIDVATAARPLTPKAPGLPMAALVNAFGFGGHNVALSFTEYLPTAGDTGGDTVNDAAEGKA
jgi:3-oxoacyl-[acyl-carrier-protein] synthase II